MDIERERKLFEAWYAADPNCKSIERFGQGYLHSHASRAWVVWKARAALDTSAN